MSGVLLDVDSYAIAMDKFEEDTQAQEEQWRNLHGMYVSNLTRLHEAMQQSDVVFWEPPQRVGTKRNKDWLGNTVAASLAHRRKLKTILGVKDVDIFQVNVFPLYSMGTGKKNTLNSIAAVLPQLPGLSLVFYPEIPKN